MTDFKKAKPKIRRRVEHQSAMGNKTHFYTSIPDPLNQEYIDGNVNDTLFRLIYTLLSQSYEFWITRAWLEKRFSSHTLQKYLPLIEKAGIVTIEKVVVTPGAHAANVYHTNHPDDWDMSLIVERKRGGQKGKDAQVQGRERSNDSEPSQTAKDAQVQGADVQDADVQDAQVQDIISTNANQTNLNHTNSNLPPQNPPAPPKASRQKISKKKLIGMISMLYGKYAKREVMETLVEELDELGSREAIMRVARSWLDVHARESTDDLEWKRAHYSKWKQSVMDEMQMTVN